MKQMRIKLMDVNSATVLRSKEGEIEKSSQDDSNYSDFLKHQKVQGPGHQMRVQISFHLPKDSMPLMHCIIIIIIKF